MLISTSEGHRHGHHYRDVRQRYRHQFRIVLGPLTTGGNDSVLGQGGNDSIQGGSGLDTLRGGEGSDNLLGGNDNDILFGDDGDDVLFGQAGDDLIDGGAGFDVVSFAASSTDGAVNVTVNNVAGVNTGISATRHRWS